MSNPTPKFPIGSRVKHNYGGPGTVIGLPFPGQITPRKAVDSDIYLQEHFRKPTAVRDEPITFDEWARNRRTVNLIKHCENAQQATSAYYEAHKDEVRKNIELRHELDDAKAVINSLRDTNKVYQEQITRKSAQIANLIETLDTVRKAVQ